MCSDLLKLQGDDRLAQLGALESFLKPADRGAFGRFVASADVEHDEVTMEDAAVVGCDDHVDVGNGFDGDKNAEIEKPVVKIKKKKM